MPKIKTFLILALATTLHLSATAQQVQRDTTVPASTPISPVRDSAPAAPPFVFEKIIYHTTHCFGICPQLDLEIDSNRNVRLHKEITDNKYRVDKRKSGKFKGKIGSRKYQDCYPPWSPAITHTSCFPRSSAATRR